MDYKFELTKEQAAKFEKWRKKQLKRNPQIPTAGERWTFSFTPTGLGTVVKAHDGLFDEEYDLTEWEHF